MTSNVGFPPSTVANYIASRQPHPPFPLFVPPCPLSLSLLPALTLEVWVVEVEVVEVEVVEVVVVVY